MDRHYDLSTRRGLDGSSSGPIHHFCPAKIQNLQQIAVQSRAKLPCKVRSDLVRYRCSRPSFQAQSSESSKPGQLAVAICVEDSVAYNASSGLCSQFLVVQRTQQTPRPLVHLEATPNFTCDSLACSMFQGSKPMQVALNAIMLLLLTHKHTSRG